MTDDDELADKIGTFTHLGHLTGTSHGVNYKLAAKVHRQHRAGSRDRRGTSRMIRHFTASGVVLSNDHVLLVEHRKLGCWLYPGGHIDPGEDPAQAVLREVHEETGIRCEIIAPARFTHPAATVIPAPWAICIQDVHDGQTGPHQHIDMIYVLRPVDADHHDGRLPAADPQLAEVASCFWAPLTSLPDIATPPELPELINAAAAYAAEPTE